VSDDALRRLAVAGSRTVIRQLVLVVVLCAAHMAHAQELNPLVRLAAI
jgi:hypothetical protein